MRGSDAATEEGRRSGRRGKDGVGCDERDGVEESQVMWGRGDGGPLCLWRCLPPLSPLLAFVRVRSDDGYFVGRPVRENKLFFRHAHG
jgi:hypothetical protein